MSKYVDLINKLFGDMGDRLTDTFSLDWRIRDVGFIGKLDGRLTEQEKDMKELKLRLNKLEGGIK